MENTITTILIVDDTKANLIALEALLDCKTKRLILANSGNEALKILLKEKIDLVLLDVQMPGMNGFEVAEIMRSNKETKSIPIIFATAINKEEKYIFKGYELGAVDYIYKPISNEILRSKVNVFVKLNEQSKIIIDKTVALERTIVELKLAEKKLIYFARMDDLTGILNRRGFEAEYELEWARAIRHKRVISVLMIDIDDFKLFNDTNGHLEGDLCLKKVATAIEMSLGRTSDVVARFGGEEFVVILPETDLEGGKTMAENIRKNIENLKIKNETEDDVSFITASIGISAIIPTNESNKVDLLDQADKALYIAKKGGKNNSEVYKYESSRKIQMVNRIK